MRNCLVGNAKIITLNNRESIGNLRAIGLSVKSRTRREGEKGKETGNRIRPVSLFDESAAMSG